LIDICIATNNDINWLRIFVDYLFKNTKDFKLYISDKVSTDSTIKYLIKLKTQYPDIVFYRVSDSCETSGINWGISQGNSPFVLVTNPGAILPEGWFERMAAHFNEPEPGLTKFISNSGKVGAVGPVLENVIGRQSIDYSYGQNNEESNILSAYCLLTKRKYLDSIGGFYIDSYAAQISKDIDVSIRFKAAGFNLVIDRTVYVKQIMQRGSTANVAQEKSQIIAKYGKQQYEDAVRIRPTVTIAIPCMGDIDHECVSSLLSLDKPGGHGSVIYAKTVRTLIANARNLLAQAALEHDSQYLLFIDSDMVYPAASLMRLLSRVCNSDISIISGLATKRLPPFEQCIMNRNGDNWGYADVPDVPGVYEIDGTGAAFMLIKTSVFKDLKKPYFYLDEHGLREDLNFCFDAKKAGHKICVDTSIYLGHLGERIVVDWQTKQQNERIKKGTFIV